jgi:hypothetical protein
MGPGRTWNCRRRIKLPGRPAVMSGWLSSWTLPPANSGNRLFRRESRDSSRRKNSGNARLKATAEEK